uniref:Uncharacterized protein n=1 Tax=Arundo donax TaxID=35708 RepID=A0A0A9QQM2_ARUDO
MLSFNISLWWLTSASGYVSNRISASKSLERSGRSLRERRLRFSRRGFLRRALGRKKVIQTICGSR